jgi:uncharacterized protein (UPF0264 family)
LLVSVRSAAEAQVALDAGADLIDVKEPNRGSLGAADPAVWGEVCGVVDGRVSVSVALGELVERAAGATAGWPSCGRGSGVTFAKIGLAGATLEGDWLARWTAAMQALPRGVRPVAVAYADWRTAAAPAPHAVLDAAAMMQSPYLLIDTYDKSRGNLLAHLTFDELRELSGCAADARTRLVLAGSLDAAAIAALAPLRPAYFAVRGAACAGARTQAIDAGRVKRLVKLVRTSFEESSN